MCSPFIRKEANRFNWLIKGKLIDKSWSDEQVEKTYNSYLARLWGNNERAVYGEVGFESAWKAREAEMLDDELKGVCVLGYN